MKYWRIYYNANICAWDIRKPQINLTEAVEKRLVVSVIIVRLLSDKQNHGIVRFLIKAWKLAQLFISMYLIILDMEAFEIRLLNRVMRMSKISKKRPDMKTRLDKPFRYLTAFDVVCRHNLLIEYLQHVQRCLCGKRDVTWPVTWPKNKWQRKRLK